jgi:hypothetical protein
VSRNIEHIEFTFDERDAVVAAMGDLVSRHTGWVNIQPIVDPERLPAPPSGLISGWLTGGLPPLPIGTFMAPVVKRGETTHGSVGLAHNANAKVARRLVEAGIMAPDGWRAVQDNARRGVVIQVPPDTDPAVVLDWILRSIEELASVPTDRTYRATIHS